MSDLRNTIMNEEDLIASKMRFALFSQPAPLAVGDDSFFHQKTSTISLMEEPAVRMGSQ
jgi:hypothetical protein